MINPSISIEALRELVMAKILAMEQLSDERDKRYTERDQSRKTAVEAALQAVKEQTGAAFLSSEKAIIKAEEAQKSYNTSHNDLARKMDEQNKATMPRPETEARFRAIEEKIGELREKHALGGGAAAGGKAVKDETRANLGLLLSITGVVFLVVGTIVGYVISHPAIPK